MLQEQLHTNINRFDVGILPYRTTIEGSPLRVYDMLSEFLQVVSTHFPDSDYFKNVIHVAESQGDVIGRISDLLSGKENWIHEETIEEFMSANTWKIRSESLVHFCESLLRR